VLCEVTEVEPSEIVHAYAAVFVACVKNAAEFLQHWIVIRMGGHGCVGGGQETAFEIGVGKFLVHVEEAGFVRRRREKVVDVVGSVFVADFFIVCAVAEEKIFVVAEEGRGVGAAFIPDQDSPALGFEDAGEFRTSFGQIEPVRGLRCGGTIDALIGEVGGFGCSCDAGEVGIGGEQAFGGFTHLAIGLDADDSVAVVEEHAGEDAGTAGDVGDDGVRGQTALRFQSFDYLGGISGAIADVIFDAGRETKRGICGGHDASLSDEVGVRGGVSVEVVLLN
jgi:hypothetical protein